MIGSRSFRRRRSTAPWHHDRLVYYSCAMLAADRTVIVERVVVGGFRVNQNVGEEETLILDLGSAAAERAGGGLSDETIARQMRSRIRYAGGEEEMCVVCLEQLSGGIARLDCGHQFHPRCITKWLHRKNNCPLCKSTALLSS